VEKYFKDYDKESEKLKAACEQLKNAYTSRIEDVDEMFKQLIEANGDVGSAAILDKINDIPKLTEKANELRSLINNLVFDKKKEDLEGIELVNSSGTNDPKHLYRLFKSTESLGKGIQINFAKLGQQDNTLQSLIDQVTSLNKTIREIKNHELDEAQVKFQETINFQALVDNSEQLNRNLIEEQLREFVNSKIKDLKVVYMVEKMKNIGMETERQKNL